MDAGPAAGGPPGSGLSELGVTNPGIGIQQNSGPVTGPFSSIASGFMNGVPSIIANNANGQAGLNFILNGAVYPLPSVIPPNITNITSLIVTPEQFGAKGDGVTDDSAAFNAALLSGGCVILVLNRAHRYFLGINGSINVPADCAIVGAGYGGQMPSGVSYAQIPGCMILGANTTITLGSGDSNGRARLSNCCIVQSAASAPALTLAQAVALPGLFTGTAVTVNGQDCSVVSCGIFGFTQAISSVGWGRTKLVGIIFDCTNGLLISGGYDRGEMDGCSGWPYLSFQAQVALQADRPAFMARNGTAFLFQGACDWAEATNCFGYGYTNTFQSDGASNIKWIGCKADNLGFPATGTLPGGGTYSQGNPNGITKAFSAINAATDTVLIGGHTNNHVYGVVNSTTRSDPSEGLMAVIGGEFITQGDAVRADGTGGVVVNSARLQAGGFGTAPVLTTSYGVNLLASTAGNASFIVCNYLFGCADGPFNIASAILGDGFGGVVKFGNVAAGMVDAYPDWNQNSLVVGAPGEQGRLIAMDRRFIASGNGGELAVANQQGGGGDPATGIMWGMRGSLQNGAVGSENSDLILRTYTSGAFQDRIKIQANGDVLPITGGTQLLGSAANAWGQVWQDSANFVSITTGSVPSPTGNAGEGAIQVDEANGYLYLATHNHVYRLTGTQVV